MVPLEIIGNENSLTAIRCKKTHPGKLDNSGRSTPVIIENSGVHSRGRFSH